jgi:hypothetical protein
MICEKEILILGDGDMTKTKKKSSIIQEDNIKKLLLRMDSELYNEVERLAEIEDRSIHGQIIHSIRNSVKNNINKK